MHIQVFLRPIQWHAINKLLSWWPLYRCQMDQELLSFALQSPPNTILDAADHLLAAGNTQAAALLYQKGGKLGKAVEMVFAAGMMDVLDSITAQLDQDADVDLVAR